jgi:putative hydrolase of the HAD superfamily
VTPARAVLFDLGGVLTESPMDAFAAYEAAAGLPAGLIRRLNATDPDTNAWARLERGEHDVDGFTEAFEREARAVDAVRRLRAAALPLALVSNNVRPMPRDGALGELLALFDVVVESSVEGVRKPEPEIYRRALDRLAAVSSRSLAPGDCAYLDDLGINLKPARALGMHTVKVADPDAALAELTTLTGVPLGDGAAA